GEKLIMEEQHHMVEINGLEQLRWDNGKVTPTFSISGFNCEEGDFVLSMVECLARFGGPAYEIEDAVSSLLEAKCVVLSSAAVVSFTNHITHISLTRVLELEHGLELGKLAMVWEIIGRVRRGELNVVDAVTIQRNLLCKPSLMGTFGNALLFPLCACLACVTQLGGDWKSTGLAGLQGLSVGMLYLASNLAPNLHRVFEVATMVSIGFISTLLYKETCFMAVALSSPLLLLPGLHATVALCELLRQSMISGLMRLFYSLIYATLMGLGICLGVRVSMVKLTLSECTHELPIFAEGGIVLVLCALYSIFLMSDFKKQLPISIGLAALAHLAKCMLKQSKVQPEFVTFFITFLLSLLANLATRLLKSSTGSLPFLLPSILMLGTGLDAIRCTFHIFIDQSNPNGCPIFSILTQPTSAAISIHLANFLIPSIHNL
ncbi:pheromone-regulated protein prm10, partial [Massospora cicadina]